MERRLSLEIQYILKEYRGSLNKYNIYTNKFDNFNEMEKFLERCKLLKETQGNIENTNISIKEMEFIMKYLLAKMQNKTKQKTLGQDSSFNREFHQISRKK